MEKYKVGDRVVVIDAGMNYTMYRDKYREMGFKFPEHDHYNGKDGFKGTIFSVGWHESDHVHIYGVNLDISGLQMLIGETGISKLEANKQYTDYIVISENYDQAVEITNHQKEICVENSNPLSGKIYYRINPNDPYDDKSGYVTHASWYEMRYPDLPILTYTQWKEMITDKPLNMNKKIIGYDVVKEFPNNHGIHRGHYFPISDDYCKEYASYLNTEYFVPIYEQEKEFVDVEIGNPVKTIRIKREGFYNILGGDVHGQITLLKEFVKNHTNKLTYFPYKWSINTLWIGCEEQGTLVTIEDMQKVIDTYEKEFGNKFLII